MGRMVLYVCVFPVQTLERLNAFPFLGKMPGCRSTLHSPEHASWGKFRALRRKTGKNLEKPAEWKGRPRCGQPLLS